MTFGATAIGCGSNHQATRVQNGIIETSYTTPKVGENHEINRGLGQRIQANTRQPAHVAIAMTSLTGGAMQIEPNLDFDQ